MHTFHKLHKLFTYTDKTLIKKNPNEILVYVYAKAKLSEELKTLRHFPESAVIPYPIAIEVRFPLTVAKESTEHVLASAEALAQVAAVSPDFYNIFGTKKGVNIIDLLLVASQPLVTEFASFKKPELSKLSTQCLSLASVYFYGAATRTAKPEENEWSLPLLTGKDEPYAIYNTSTLNVFNRFCIENKYGKFFITRVAIEDFLSLPHRYRGVDVITRPFKAARGVFGQELKEAIPGSPFAPYKEFNEQGLRNKVLLAPGIWRCRIILIEEDIFGEPVYIVRGMPPFMAKAELDEYKANGTDHFVNSENIRNYIKEKQKLAVEGKLG